MLDSDGYDAGTSQGRAHDCRRERDVESAHSEMVSESQDEPKSKSHQDHWLDI